MRRLFLRFSFPIVDTLLAVVVTKARLRQKLASLPLCKLYEKTTFSAWQCKHFTAFVRLFILHRFFLRFSFPIVCTLPAVVVTKSRLLQKLAGYALLQIVQKRNFFGVAIQAFSCFCQALCFAPSFCIGKVFSVCRKRAQTPAQRTNEYLFFLFSAKAVLLAFLYFCFGQIFTSLHLFLAVKIIKCK